MFRSMLSRGVSAGALTLALTSLTAAQQSLPTIDVGAVQQQRQGSARPALSGGAPSTLASPSPPASPAPGSLAYRLSTPRAQGYVVTSATTGTKDNTPIMQTPASVQVVPQAVIEDQKVTRVQEALENVSGVLPNQSIGSGTGFIIRGFSDQRTMFRNGLLATSASGFRSDFDSANVERIEVLKGPAAMLYGRMEPGGLINIVTKRPLDTPLHFAEQRFGSYGHYRTVWDATGPVFKDGSLLYRFSGAYENSGSFRDFNHLDRVLLNPSVALRPTQDTDFVVDFEYFEQDRTNDNGIPAFGDRPAPIPINRTLHDPNEPRANLRKFHLGSELTHRFNEHLAFRNRFLASFVHTDDIRLVRVPTLRFAPSNGGPLDGVLRRNIFGQISDAEVYATNLDLLGNFELVGTRHEALVGFDYTLSDTEYSTNGANAVRNPAFDINIFYPWPSYGVPGFLFNHALLSQISSARSVFYSDQKGAYFQDHITIMDKLHIFGGGRYDWAEGARGNGLTLDAARAAIALSYPSIIRKDEAFTPRVGVLFQPLPWASVYGSWTTGFGLNNGVDKYNKQQPPQESEQTEVGVKTELFEQRLIATLAAYHLTRTNLLTRDFTSPDPTVTRAIGAQRSKGVEFDAVGKIADNLSLIGSFTYLDARVIKDNTLNATRTAFDTLGHRLPNVPRYAGSLWFKWEVKEVPQLEGLSLGFGAYVVGSRQGNLQSTFQLPGYVRFDAMAAYTWKSWWGTKRPRN
jgi:iron complex outermembrane receptor protein